FYFYTSETDNICSPQPSHEYSFPKNNIHKQSTNAERSGLNRIKVHHTWKNIMEKIQNNSIGVDSTEVIVSGVPNYLWYLNCLITSEVMIIGYWNDHGYSNFIPGGNSINGYYWGLIEEYSILAETTWHNLTKYTQAIEFGNSFQFDLTLSGDIEGLSNWDFYKSTIDSFQHPINITWVGEPYGNHATVGVGYKIIDSQRFLILHDTWHVTPYYVNYDEYQSSLFGCIHWCPATSGKNNHSIIQQPENDIIYFDPINIIPEKVEFDPRLTLKCMPIIALKMLI
ncbi:MAG: hypothetical protein R6V04_08635, partial [bacterium]